MRLCHRVLPALCGPTIKMGLYELDGIRHRDAGQLGETAADPVLRDAIVF